MKSSDHENFFPVIYHIARAFIGFPFLCAVIITIIHIPLFLSYTASGGLAYVGLLLPLIIYGFGCGFMLTLRWKSISAAVIVALFAIRTTAMSHAFWSAAAASFLTQLTRSLKDVVLFGGSLMIIGAERANGHGHD